MATKYVFPVQGFTGQVELHHNTSTHAADLFGTIGTPILAMTSGTVVSVGVNDKLGGNNVTYLGDDGKTYYNAHMRDKPLVSAAQRLAAGQTIGLLGDTGNAKGTTPHLHIGIGYGIIEGDGPDGGGGIGFNTTTFLREVLSNGGVVTGNNDQPDTGTGGTGSSNDPNSTGLNSLPGFALLYGFLKAVADLWGKG